MKHRGETISNIFESTAFAKLSALVPALSGTLSTAEDDEVLLKTAKNTLRSLWPGALTEEYVADVAKEFDFDTLQVIRATMESVSVTPGCLTLKLFIYAVPKGADYEFREDITPKGTVISGVATKTLVRLEAVFVEDTVNKETMSYISDVMILQVATQNDTEYDQLLAIPTGRATSFENIPVSIVTKTKYGSIPAGTEMLLDFETLLYRDQDMKVPGGIPAEVVAKMWSDALGSPSPAQDLFVLGSLCQITSDEVENDDDEDGLSSNLRDLIGLQSAMTDPGDDDMGLDDDFWNNLDKEEDK